MGTGGRKEETVTGQDDGDTYEPFEMIKRFEYVSVCTPLRSSGEVLKGIFFF